MIQWQLMIIICCLAVTNVRSFRPSLSAALSVNRSCNTAIYAKKPRPVIGGKPKPTSTQKGKHSFGKPPTYSKSKPSGNRRFKNKNNDDDEDDDFNNSDSSIPYLTNEDDYNNIVGDQRKGPKNTAVQTILGENIINCRDFSVDSPKKFEFLCSHNTIEAIPIYPLPEIAFVGRSNVGKSSLINCLTNLNKNIAKQSKTPGRTQSINLFKCSDPNGDLCVFVDLPGYGFAKIEKSRQETISRFLVDYLKHRGALKFVVLLLDVRREPQELDKQMMEVRTS